MLFLPYATMTDTARFCRRCQVIIEARAAYYKASGAYFHISCFTCYGGGCAARRKLGEQPKNLGVSGYFVSGDKFVCPGCVNVDNIAVCSVCQRPLSEEAHVRLAIGEVHFGCQRCGQCGLRIGCYSELVGDVRYCASCCRKLKRNVPEFDGVSPLSDSDVGPFRATKTEAISVLQDIWQCIRSSRCTILVARIEPLCLSFVKHSSGEEFLEFGTKRGAQPLMKMKRAYGEDAGKYTLTATKANGKDQHDVDVIVLGKRSPLQGPLAVKDVYEFSEPSDRVIAKPRFLKRQGKQQYTNVELARVVERIKDMFKQFQLTRSPFFARISNDLTVMKAKLIRSEEKLSRVAFPLLNQLQATQRQRQVIAARVAEAHLAQDMLDRFCCGVCFDREKDTAFDCGHMFCYECAKNLETLPQGCCPMCRDKIKAVMEVDH